MGGAGRGGGVPVIVKKYVQVVVCRTLTRLYILFIFFSRRCFQECVVLF